MPANNISNGRRLHWTTLPALYCVWHIFFMLARRFLQTNSVALYPDIFTIFFPLAFWITHGSSTTKTACGLTSSGFFMKIVPLFYHFNFCNYYYFRLIYSMSTAFFLSPSLYFSLSLSTSLALTPLSSQSVSSFQIN